jgi:hypothetical protein
MSGFREGTGDVARDAIGGIGDAYQDILLQDSPIARSTGLEATNPWLEADTTDQPWDSSFIACPATNRRFAISTA